MSLIIEYLDTNVQQPEWDLYVYTNAESSIFHQIGWLRLVSHSYKYTVYACVVKEHGKIIGICPLVHLKTRLFGDSLISTAFGTTGGILADTNDAMYALQHAIEKLSNSLGVDYLECRSRTASLGNEWQTKASTYFGYQIELEKDPEKRMQQFRKKKRNEIRKALRNNLTVEKNVPIEQFYQVYAESLRDHGTPVHNLNWYKNILTEFGDKAQTLLVRHKTQPLCTCLALYHNGSVTPHYSGGIKAARPFKAFDVLYWSLMEEAIKRDHLIFDFGRSKGGTGAAAYKAYWGFSAIPLEYQYYLPDNRKMPDINPNNPKYAAFVRLWQYLPLKLSNTIGPLLARQLG